MNHLNPCLLAILIAFCPTLLFAQAEEDSLARAVAERDSLAKVLVAKDSVVVLKGNIDSAKPKKDYFVQGGSVSVDLIGPIMRAASSKFSQMEIQGRMNLKGRFFPLLEVGLGYCRRGGHSKDNVFETQAPYFRFGVDVNMNKKRYNPNRFMIGFRVGYSKFSYDYTIADQEDPVWKTTQNYTISGLSASAVWGEAVLGFETRLWRFIHFGWNGRYKFRFTQSCYEHGDPWYIPGYGPNGTNCWGGTVNLIFEFGR